VAKAGKKLDRAVFNGESPIRSLFSSPELPNHRTEPPPGFDPERPEESYRQVVPREHRCRYGQFFTPPALAAFMCEWIAACRPRTVLDPATGPGIFIRELLRQVPESSVTAIDVDPTALGAARTVVGAKDNVEFIRADFLTWPAQAKFDAAIANPPYLKHHNFHYDHDIFSEVGRRCGVHLSRLTNIHVLFILEICRRLREGGRAAVIVPGEWVNANYGRGLKHFLLERSLLRALIYFAHSSLVFEDSLTTASVLLIEKARGKQERNAVLTAYVQGEVDMRELMPILKDRLPRTSGVIVQRLPSTRLLKTGKWDYLLSHEVGEKAPGFVALSELAETRRGIATGANKYFHVPYSAAVGHGIRARQLLPCVGRAADVPSVIFREGDFDRLTRMGRRTHLISLHGDLNEAERAYVNAGEAKGLPQRYLLAARNPWYEMERREPSAIWAAVFGRKGLRFVYNCAGVHNLTTFHCVYPKSPDSVFAKALAAALNSRRIQERSKQHRRVYGGGLAKFEPKDLLDIEVPDLRVVGRAMLLRLAACLDDLDVAIRTHSGEAEALNTLDVLVDEAASRAARVSGSEEPTPENRGLSSDSLLLEQQTHRDVQVV